MVNSALLEADGILDGFVQNDSALYDAIQSSTSVLAVVQLVEQELNTDPTANNGVLAFEYNGNTYIGDVTDPGGTGPATFARSEEHTSELQSLMRISYAVFCLKK